MSKPLARATAALLGQNPMGEDEATTAAGPLELGDDAVLRLPAPADPGALDGTVP